MIAAALLSLVLAADACSLPPLAGAPPWRTGESMTFELGVLGLVKAGTLELSVERPMSGGKVIPLRARARTDTAVANVKRFAAVGLSWVDARTLLPERYRDEASEDGVKKMSDTRLRPGGSEVVIEYQYGDRKGKVGYPRDGDVLDALAAIYYLRAARLEPGTRICSDLVANRRFWRLEATVAQRTERVETPAGRFDTLRIDARIRRKDRPDAPARPLHLWLSTDARRLLVSMVSEVDVGPVQATLTSFRGAGPRKP